MAEESLFIIGRLGQGNFLNDLHRAIERVSNDVIATGRAGSVAVTLKIEPVKDSIMVVVSEAIQVKPPKRDAKGALFFVHTGLHEEDTRQSKLDVSDDDAPPRIRSVTITSDQAGRVLDALNEAKSRDDNDI